MELHGKQIIGQKTSAEGPAAGVAFNPATGEELPTAFHHATAGEVERAVALAALQAGALRAMSPAKRGFLLERIAEEIEALEEPLVERAHAESGLPIPRLSSEVGRTAGQLRMFGRLVGEGSWVDARIDPALPEREPLPRPDIRRMLIPVGPVAVFCASNFPLAFSTAGVDTAAALAAGCPVIVKAHHAHPGTAELTGRAVQRAARSCGAPQGTFSLLHGPGSEVGAALVTHAEVKAVGFTGSQQGGRALFDAAAARPEPIPVYAEMASTNPVFILPGAMGARGQEIAEGLVGSITLGAGQFCTNPGVTVCEQGPEARSFLERLGGLLAGAQRQVMLHPGIRATFAEGIARLEGSEGADLAAGGVGDPGPGKSHVGAALLITSGPRFLADEDLRVERFGPSTLAVVCANRDEMLAVARSFRGELTATIHGDETELPAYADLAAVLERRVGRLVFNGFPTGVEVCPAMNHGGPYPATTDSHFTSVGTATIHRYARPVCFQGCPDSRLPVELQNANPLGIWRTVDGELTKDQL